MFFTGCYKPVYNAQFFIHSRFKLNVSELNCRCQPWVITGRNSFIWGPLLEIKALPGFKSLCGQDFGQWQGLSMTILVQRQSSIYRIYIHNFRQEDLLHGENDFVEQVRRCKNVSKITWERRLLMFLILAQWATDFTYFPDQHKKAFQGKGNKL